MSTLQFRTGRMFASMATAFSLFFALTATAQESIEPDPSLSNPAVSQVPDAGTVEVFFDSAIETLMKTENSPSGVIAIAHQGKLLFAKGYGYQDIDQQIKVDPNQTLFRPGSVSKLATWVAVMQLVEQGKLDLHADVNQYLKTFQIEEAFDQPITLQHILTHTAGFEDGGIGYLIFDDPSRIMPLQEAMKYYQPKRVNPPGAQTAYSNYATSLAGLIVSNVSGMPFNEYIEKHIFQPLGMNQATFDEPLPAHLADSMAKSYQLVAGEYVEKPFEIIANFGPAGGISASGTDMLKFAEAILEGGSYKGQRILQEQTLKQMLTRQFTHDDRLMGMGLGFYEADYSGTSVWGHGGDTQYFHSFLGVDQEHELSFFVSFASEGGSAIRSSIMTDFYTHFFPREETAPTPPKDFAERAVDYAGDYGFWRTNFSKIEKAFGLSSGISVIPTADNTLVLSLGGHAKQYVEVADDLFKEMNSGVSMIPGISPRLVAFQRNEAGEVSGFVMDGLPFMSLRKLAFYETSSFNFSLIGLSMAVFLWVLLRRFFQRAAIKALPATERSATQAAVWASTANVLVMVVGAVVMSVALDSLFDGVPLLLKLWLVLPILATVAGFYLLYKNLSVWQQGMGSFWFRVRYTLVTVCALSMCWFYYFWNILGFQYLE